MANIQNQSNSVQLFSTEQLKAIVKELQSQQQQVEQREEYNASLEKFKYDTQDAKQLASTDLFQSLAKTKSKEDNNTSSKVSKSHGKAEKEEDDGILGIVSKAFNAISNFFELDEDYDVITGEHSSKNVFKELNESADLIGELSPKLGKLISGTAIESLNTAKAFSERLNTYKPSSIVINEVNPFALAS